MGQSKKRPQAERVIELHDQGMDTNSVMREVDLPWFIVTQILKGADREIRPMKFKGRRDAN